MSKIRKKWCMEEVNTLLVSVSKCENHMPQKLMKRVAFCCGFNNIVYSGIATNLAAFAQ